MRTLAPHWIIVFEDAAGEGTWSLRVGGDWTLSAVLAHARHQLRRTPGSGVAFQVHWSEETPSERAMRKSAE